MDLSIVEEAQRLGLIEPATRESHCETLLDAGVYRSLPAGHDPVRFWFDSYTPPAPDIPAVLRRWHAAHDWSG